MTIPGNWNTTEPNAYEVINVIKDLHNGITSGTCPECKTPHPCRTVVYVDNVLMARFEIPTDMITGYPFHYIVNGDHSGCRCGRELTDEEKMTIAAIYGPKGK